MVGIRANETVVLLVAEEAAVYGPGRCDARRRQAGAAVAGLGGDVARGSGLDTTSPSTSTYQEDQVDGSGWRTRRPTWPWSRDGAEHMRLPNL